MAESKPTDQPSSIARWLSQVPLTCAEWDEQKPPPTTPDAWALGIMASGAADDPWDWDVDRIVQELCTNHRIWTPRSRSSSIGDPVAMESIIREQEIIGEVLLSVVDDHYLERAGVKALGRRVFVLSAIDQFRLKSAEYQKQTQNNVVIPRSEFTHLLSVGHISRAVEGRETVARHQQVATASGPGDSNIPAASVHSRGPLTISPSDAISARMGRAAIDEYLTAPPEELQDFMATMEASKFEKLKTAMAAAEKRISAPRNQLVLASRPASSHGALSHLPDGPASSHRALSHLPDGPASSHGALSHLPDRPVASSLGAFSHLPDAVEQAVEQAERASQGTTLVSEEPESKRQKLNAPTTVSNGSTLHDNELSDSLMFTPSEDGDDLLREARTQTPGRDAEIDTGSTDSARKRKRSESIAEQEYSTRTDQFQQQLPELPSPVPDNRKRATLMSLKSFTPEEAAARMAEQARASANGALNLLHSLNINPASVRPSVLNSMVAQRAFQTPVTQSDNTNGHVHAGSSQELPANGNASQDSEQPTDDTSGQVEAQSSHEIRSEGSEIDAPTPQTEGTNDHAKAEPEPDVLSATHGQQDFDPKSGTYNPDETQSNPEVQDGDNGPQDADSPGVTTHALTDVQLTALPKTVLQSNGHEVQDSDIDHIPNTVQLAPFSETIVQDNGDEVHNSDHQSDGTHTPAEAQLTASPNNVVQNNGDGSQSSEPESDSMQAPADARVVASTDPQQQASISTSQPGATSNGQASMAQAPPVAPTAQQESNGPLITPYPGPYFKKRSLPVDDVFYEGTKLGEDLALPELTGVLTLWRSPNIPTNVRAFVNSRIQHFLLSKPLTFTEEPRELLSSEQDDEEAETQKKDELADQKSEGMVVDQQALQHADQMEADETQDHETTQTLAQYEFTVVVPYQKRLQDRPGSIVKQQKPSCTVFYTADDGKIHAERTMLGLYPEVEEMKRSRRHGIRPGYTWPTLPEARGSQKFKVTMRGLRKDIDNEKGPKPRGDRKFFLGRDEPITPEELEKRIILVYGNVENDVLLPVFGESGSENEYSTDVLKEIAREAGEDALDLLGHSRKPRKKKQKHVLTPDEINEVLDDALGAFELEWKKRHLPELEKKAWQIWTKCRKQGTTDLQITTARSTIDHNEQRLSAQRDKFVSAQWHSKKLLRITCAAMELTVFSLNELRWKVALLEAGIAPSKPLQKPKISTPKGKKTLEAHDDDEGELLSTDSDEFADADEEMSDFVVPDDEDQSDLVVDENEMLQQQCAAAEDEHFQIGAEADIEDERDLPEDMEAVDTPGPSRSRSRSPVVEPATPEAPRSKGKGPAQFDSSETLGNDTSLSQTNGASASLKGKNTTWSNVAGSTVENTIDLTESPPADGRVIDLVTPEKSEAEKISSKSRAKKNLQSSPSLKLKFHTSTSRSSSPKSLKQASDSENLPSLYDPATINKYSYAAWSRLCDADRFLIKTFYNKSDAEQAELLDYFLSLGQEKFRAKLEKVATALKGPLNVAGKLTPDHYHILARFVLFFHFYVDCRKGKFEPLDELLTNLSTKQKYPIVCKVLEHLENDEYFIAFFNTCSKMKEYLSGFEPASAPSTPSPSSRNGKGKETMWSNDMDEEEEDDAPRSSVKRRRDTTMSTSEQFDTEASPRPKRKKKIQEDVSARHRREQDKERQSQQEQRRTLLQEKLFRSGQREDLDLARLVINATGDQESSIRIHDHIAGSIKPHQIDGVRFMWNQIVGAGEEEETQGCLLAHTMGLGKTMQTITLLVAIAEAASSIKESIWSQVPQSLRVSRTLILCPPSLIDNWLDELLTWAPKDMLGEIRKVDSSMATWKKRLQVIADWHEDGGVLVLGYQMLSLIIENKPRWKKKPDGVKIKVPPVPTEHHDTVSAQLLHGPNIVVADEAHYLKNGNTDVTKTAQRFRTKSRIALTGSPLANMLADYYHMINFVAPGYLGPEVEFSAKYVEPIQTGLYQDSTNYERRKALKMLKVLNDDLAPKINRADMSVLKHDLPSKTEFVITIPLTDIQKEAYTIYVRSMLQGEAYQRTKAGDIAQTTIWHWLAILSLLCNHPACFKSKLLQRKDDAQKTLDSVAEAPDSNEGTQDGDIDVNAPIWKTGVSENLIAQEKRLFEQGDLDIESVDLSCKAVIMCQILDAAKAAGDKTLVFSESIPTLDYLTELCKKQGRNFDRLDGKTAMPRRQQLTKDFNHGKTDVCLISTGAGGLGLNLQGANRVIIFDFKFNPTKEEQAVGRAYRIGQKKHTYVYRFVAGGTFEASIHNKAIYKKQLASRVIDKKKPIAYAKKNLGEYLFEPKDVPQLDLSEFKGVDPLVLDKILASQADLSTIRGIVQSDTFERDDNDKLTAEEEKEVETMQHQEKLKRSDPKRWEQLYGHPSSAVHTRPQFNQGNRPSTPSGYPAQNQGRRRPSTASVNQGRVMGESSKTGALFNATPGTETRILPPSSRPNAFTPAGPPNVPMQFSTHPNGHDLPSPLAATSSVPRPLSPILGASTQREPLQTLPSSMPHPPRRQAEEPHFRPKKPPLRTFLLAALKAIKGSTLPEDEDLAYSKAEDIQTLAHASFPGLNDRKALFSAAFNALMNSQDLCRQIVTSQLSIQDFIHNLMQSSSQQTPTSSSSSGQTEIGQVGAPNSSRQFPSERGFDSWETSALQEYLNAQRLGNILGSREKLLDKCKHWEQGELYDRAQQAQAIAPASTQTELMPPPARPATIAPQAPSPSHPKSPTKSSPFEKVLNKVSNMLKQSKS